MSLLASIYTSATGTSVNTANQTSEPVSMRDNTFIMTTEHTHWLCIYQLTKCQTRTVQILARL